MERFLDLSKRDDVVEKVLEDWLLRELRDEIVSLVTWKEPTLAALLPGLRVRADRRKPLDVYYLSPVGIGGKFFYEYPVGETLYSAECEVVVESVEGAIKTRLAAHRLYWVGSGDPKGYRISEGFDDLLEAILAAFRKRAPKA